VEKILVTGGTGYLAQWIIQTLLQKDYFVRTTIRNLKKSDELAALLGNSSHLEFVHADLTEKDCWLNAVSGIDKVIHVASPLGGDNPNDNAIIDIAVQGTTYVLEAAIKEGISHVVMTSSLAASTPMKSEKRQDLDESLWSNQDNPDLNAYRLSKLFAEEAAWKLIKGTATELTTILPGAIFGPSLSGAPQSSTALIQQIINGSPAPKILLEVSDVRDLAELHFLALEEKAKGQRYVAVNGGMTFLEAAKVLKDGLGTKGQKIKTFEIPNFILKPVAKIVPPLRSLIPMIGRTYLHTSQKAVTDLGWKPRPSEETILDTGLSLINHKAN